MYFLPSYKLYVKVFVSWFKCFYDENFRPIFFLVEHLAESDSFILFYPNVYTEIILIKKSKCFDFYLTTKCFVYDFSLSGKQCENQSGSR